MQQLLSPVEHLFEEDHAVVFAEYLYQRPDEFFDSLYDKILLYVSYDSQAARTVLQTGVWYYCFCVNTLMYHYKYDPHFEFLERPEEFGEKDDAYDYSELLYQYIKSNEKHISRFSDLVREVASILHWKQMKIYADKEPYIFIDRKDGKEKMLWFYIKPQGWDIYYITPEFKFSPDLMLLTDQYIKELENTPTQWRMVNDIEALLLRHYAASYLLKTFIPNDELHSLVYESIENILLRLKRENISEEIITAIKVATYLLNTTTENRVNVDLQDALQSREAQVPSDLPDEGQYPVPVLFEFRTSWLRKRHIYNPSRDIFNLIFAAICCVCPKYKPLYEYYKGKIMFEEGIQYLSALSKLPDIIANADNQIVKKYVNKYYYPEFLLTPYVITDDTYPRSIESIVSDLNFSEVNISGFTLPLDTMKHKFQGKKVFGIGELNDSVADALTKDISILVDFVNQIAAKQFIENNDDAKLLLSQIIVGRELGASTTEPLAWYNDKGEFLGYLVSKLYVKGKSKCFGGIDMKDRADLKTKFDASEASSRALKEEPAKRRGIVDKFVAKCEALNKA